jgi:hypothetical protein
MPTISTCKTATNPKSTLASVVPDTSYMMEMAIHFPANTEGNIAGRILNVNDYLAARKL